ncbi:MAG: GIY-YIG nuclease family protein [Deltaproteobacteria bacterium]|nr:GIY-YIG nuclease family protein [Candidatus Zymogenaceae bacterium]
MNRQYYVYIMTNRTNTVLYTDVTNNLKRRVHEHKEKTVEGFTKKYNVTKLVYYEITESVETAIFREKQIKDGSRSNKKKAISDFNPNWDDLYTMI